jgi:hypothetical protein
MVDPPRRLCDENGKTINSLTQGAMIRKKQSPPEGGD